MGLNRAGKAAPLIIWHPAATAPEKHVKANGAALSRTAYAWLFGQIGTTFGAGDGATTFQIPDLRGEFLRGLDDGRGVDTGRALGSAQAGEIQSHAHATIIATSSYDAGGYFWNGNSGGNVAPPNTGAAGGAETRPRNVAGLYCIRVAP